MLWFPRSATKSIPSSSTVISPGKLNWAVAASPSIKPGVPDPAIVETLPSVSIRRILWFPSSATKSIPLSSTVIPLGILNWAVAASPSIKPGVPVPAMVETLPSVSIRRMLWFPASATKSIPLSSTVIPRGLLNWAVAASPSVKPEVPVPAIVETLPSISIRRILWLKKSVTKSTPLSSTVIPLGLRNRAVAESPSINPPSPVPATVETV